MWVRVVDLELPGLFSLKILAWESWLEGNKLRYKYLYWRVVCSVQTLDYRGHFRRLSCALYNVSRHAWWNLIWPMASRVKFLSVTFRWVNWDLFLIHLLVHFSRTFGYLFLTSMFSIYRNFNFKWEHLIQLLVLSFFCQLRGWRQLEILVFYYCFFKPWWL